MTDVERQGYLDEMERCTEAVKNGARWERFAWNRIVRESRLGSEELVCDGVDPSRCGEPGNLCGACTRRRRRRGLRLIKGGKQ